MTSPSDNKERYLSRSLLKGLEILKLFGPDQPSLSLAEIAQKLGVSRTTPYRLLYTLQQAGYLRQDDQTKRYELTPKVLELGFAYLNSLSIIQIAQPYLEQLRDETGASAHMGILDGKEVVYIARVAANSVSSINVNIGSRLPAHATAMGKVLLAYQPDEDIQKLLTNELSTYTHYTKSVEELQQELKEIKEKGFAVSNEEFESGIRSIAAPIFDPTGRPRAAVNVAAPAYALDEKTLMEVCLPAVQKTARQLSAYSRK